MAKKKKKKCMEFSKKILLTIGVAGFAVVVFSCYMMYITHDLTPLGYLIPAMFIEVGVGTGFYYNKAKYENLIKIEKGMEVERRLQEYENQLETETNEP